MRVIAASLLALVCFGVVAGPYVAALSKQRGRFDFGDSGALNYAWYVGGTEKMHLEPWMTDRFGSAEVHLKHPEKQLLASPPIYSYAALPWGTYPDWYDTTYWNDHVKPHFALRGEISRGARNCVLVLRYLFNHPEGLILLGLLMLLGARLMLPWRPRANAFWIPSVALGAIAWFIYWTVNTEERYVTFAFLCIILTLFATLAPRRVNGSGSTPAPVALLVSAASLLPLLLALLATGDSLRTVLEDRRQLSIVSAPGGWYSFRMHHAAEALRAMGVEPGDTVACIGYKACLDDQYWARVAGIRILTEIYVPEGSAYAFWAALPNRTQALNVVRGQGAKALVGDFDGARVSTSDAAFRDWQQLDDTTFYALPLNVSPTH